MPEHKNTLTVRQIVGAYKALAHLDGFTKETKEGVAVVPYKFDDNTRWNIGKDMDILEPEAERYEKLRVSLIKELSPVLSDVTKESQETQDQFSARHEAIFAREVELSGLLKVKKSALLKDDINPIQGTVLRHLMPILDES